MCRRTWLHGGQCVAAALCALTRCCCPAATGCAACPFRPAISRYLAPSVLSLAACTAAGVLVGLIFPYCLELTRNSVFDEDKPAAPDSEQETSCTVDCMDGRKFELAVTATTTCGELLSEVKSILGLDGGTCNSYALFRRIGAVGGADILLDDQLRMAAVLSAWPEEASQQESAVAGENNLSSVPSSLVFKVLCWFEVDLVGMSLAEQQFVYEQTVADVLQRSFAIDDVTMIRLAAFRLQHKLGDCRGRESFPTHLQVHPLQIHRVYSPIPPQSPTDRELLASIKALAAKAKKAPRSKKENSQVIRARSQLG
eukprot:m.2387 g.2387  ORF g.2387 m.2387 type:complete len:312 (-) comp1787_c0_seq1:417-1352(-)